MAQAEKRENVMWKSARETEADLQQLEAAVRERLGHLFALHFYWQNAVYPDGYQANEAWNELVVLNEIGDCLPELSELRNRFPEPDVLLAIFVTFFHHEILIDWSRSNLDGIITLLELELSREKLRLPYRFERLLYDRFNDVHQSSQTVHLLAPDVRQLLEGTPQGVYHVGNFVSGPLGVLEVEEVRWIPPALKLPLWHCSDTGCQAIHSVKLVPPNVPVVEAFREIQISLSNRFGPASEWNQSIRQIYRWGRWPHGRRHANLPVVIANCFVDSERRKMLEAALASEDGEKLRAIIARSRTSTGGFRGSPSQVAQLPTPTATIQLLWTLDDRRLVALCDALIEKREIVIPVGENRPARTRPPMHSNDSCTEVSPLGLRSARVEPIVFMFAAILRAYYAKSLTTELEWRVSREGSQSLEESVVRFIREKGPREALQHLVLSSQAITEVFCAECGVPFENYSAESSRDLDHLLWKIGFEPMQYDDSLHRFRNRLKEFEQQVFDATPIESEDSREAIRSRGVNLFVSVEEFLEQLVAFNVWTLASDHFIEHKFSWCMAKARELVPRVLGDVLLAGAVEHRWSVDGQNSLGTLLRYMSESCKWMTSLAATDRSKLLRPEDDLPHFASDPDRRFPFRHRELWADTEIVQLRKYVDGYQGVVSLMEQAGLAEIRNGIDHHRDAKDFPDGDKMLACVARLRSALEQADAQRYIPKTHWLHRTVIDRFGFAEFEFRDYADRKVVIRGPRMASGLPGLSRDQPIVIPGGHLLGHPNSTLTLRVRDSTEYSEFWDGYPRRRKIPPPKPALPDDRSMSLPGDLESDVS